MATIFPRRASFVCRSCQKLSAVKSNRRQFISQVASPTKQEPIVLPKPRRRISVPLARRAAPVAAAAESPADGNSSVSKRTSSSAEINRTSAEVSSTTSLDPPRRLNEFRKFVAQIQSSNAAADKDDVLEALMDMYEFAGVLVHGGTGKMVPEETAARTTTTQGKEMGDALLQDLAEDNKSSPRLQSVGVATIDSISVPGTGTQTMSLSFREDAAKRVSQLAYDLLRDPKVYITEDMLQMYVRILCLLGRPEYLPEIFHLYATKKIPAADSSNPVKYSNPWPRLPKYAVPLDLAEAALESAILKKNLPLALAIIDTTVGAPAFRTNKALRQGSVPGLIVGATPLIAYAGADWVSHWQNTMDVEMAKYTAIAGAVAYIGTLTTIGFVAVTTYNDQMQRVVWRPGTHLSSRWLREDERRFFDRLALAWGFQDKSRWGEEHGAEWQRLRDECGLRDMILDKTDLMEGMK
ncbi:uncharacterized protein Z520_08733 [Fonsecaea multimorphosa CBS 102226]|uniref:Uncharacterized protein n=1 Tax=Fonsecaea multimorphosa CBS 102226 TaxID=1442371 RepID=A0A0D2KG15_9EURO|nr:uncharacterized protein Z520_08733 [Fonsecaea multimorphosa CBS 102226]KIX95613.1 hypothetical protein Z520_08733 [Fonsecaea multimorphosa CBS 102226]OAL21217.1 hypothetical protein AYO22_08180 [Fonsecaea multimorphosa]